jgi:hypothetical protein
MLSTRDKQLILSRMDKVRAEIKVEKSERRIEKAKQLEKVYGNLKAWLNGRDTPKPKLVKEIRMKKKKSEIIANTKRKYGIESPDGVVIIENMEQLEDAWKLFEKGHNIEFRISKDSPELIEAWKERITKLRKK